MAPLTSRGLACSFRSLSASIVPHRSGLIRQLRAALLLAAVPMILSAQGSPPPAVLQRPVTAADSTLRIVLLTMGQGDQVYELFGHNAIWVHDPSTRSDIVYNWGVFDFRTPGFLGRFLLGDMRYMMVGETIDNTLATYQYLKRRVWAQELDLTAAEKRALVDFVRWNVQPENTQYRYNYYLDNCSTRVRDAIDRVLGGQLRDYLRAIPTEQTYRSHSLRMMQGEKLLVTGVDLVLGRPTDVKLSADQASFLPVQLMQYARGLKLDGGTRPLVAREFLLSDAPERAAEPEHVPSMWKGLVPVGLALGLVILLLGFRVSRPVWAASLIAIVAGIEGLIGVIMTLLVSITDHVAAHANENMFMLNPLWLVVAVAVPVLLMRGKAGATARGSALAGAVVALGAVVLHVIGLSRQPNWAVIGLLLPSQLAIAAIALAYSRRATPDRAVGNVKN
jgi:hypothetical protein